MCSPPGGAGIRPPVSRFLLLRSRLGLENERITERQIVGHVDSVLALLLEGD